MSAWELPPSFMPQFTSVWVNYILKKKIPIDVPSPHYSHYFGRKSEHQVVLVRTLYNKKALFSFACVLLSFRGFVSIKCSIWEEFGSANLASLKGGLVLGTSIVFLQMMCTVRTHCAHSAASPHGHANQPSHSLPH